MNIRIYFLVVLALLATQPSLAQTLIPATSEDISEFDRKVDEQMKNFGSEVSAEAKKLSDTPGDQDKNFGQWVSSQRKKDDQGRPTSVSHGKSADHASSNSNSNGNGKGKKK